VNYLVTLIYDGITREYHCENHGDTVILFAALFQGTKWDNITVTDTRTGYVMQETRPKG
jgi:hypothetical protein